MKELNVRIINKTTLSLEERGDIGDTINLIKVQSIDNSFILESIRNKTDETYQELLKKEIDNYESKKQLSINEAIEKYNKANSKLQLEKNKLESEIIILEKQIQNEKSLLTTQNQSKIDLLEQKLKDEKEKLETRLKSQFSEEKIIMTNKISNYENEIKTIKNTAKLETEKLIQDTIHKKEQELQKLENQLKTQFFEEKGILVNKISNFENELKTIKNTVKLETEKSTQDAIHKKEQEIQKLNNDIKNIELEHKVEINKNNEKLNQEIQKLNSELDILRRDKALKNIKQIGEGLEDWCNEEFRKVSTFGFKTSTWYKDNTTVKFEGEDRGTKGDYIFKVYNNDKHEHLLTSVMCEMKSEAADSVNKKKNSDHYKKLDSDRKKKNLEYAILISELEYNVESDSPIFAVRDYEKMFVVRPQFFITLLGIIESIGTKYSELITRNEEEKIEFKEANKIIEEFDYFKKSMLDNALKHIDTQAKDIKKKAETIILSANNILESANKIVDTHLATVINKIEGYSINSIIRKIDKI